MNQKLFFSTFIIILYHLFSYISPIKATDNIQNRSNWWKEVNSKSNLTSSSTNVDYVPSGTVRSLINSTISGNEYWHTNNNGQRLTTNSSNRNEIYNEIVQPESIVVLPARNGNTKIIRKIKRTFKNKTIKQINDQPPEENVSEWKENAAFVEPSITLDQNLPTFTTTIAPIINLSKASTDNLIQSTATDLDNLITSKVKWDDDNEMLPLRSPVFKTKINNQESIYEKFANLMPLPPPNAQQTTTTASASVENQINSNENSNNLQSSSHHSVVAPLSSANSNYFNFNSKIVHTLPATRSDGNNKNQRKKQNKQARNANNKMKSPLQDFIVETDKIEKKVDDQHVGPKKTVDFTSRVNHEISPKNNLLAHLLKNNPLAIPLGKKTYKVTKKATPSVPPTVLTKRMQTPVNYANSRASSLNDDYATTTPMSTLSNDNLDNIQFKATPSKQDYTWGRRVQASNNLVSKTNAKANQLAKRNEWSGNDEQKDLINDKIADNNNESDEESVENEENTNSEDTEIINNNNDELNNEFNKNIEAIRNEESPKFDFVTFKAKNNRGPDNQLVKSNLNNVKSLPIQIISWRQAINHNRKKNDAEPKQFAGERLTSAKLTVSNRGVRKEQQIEREKPAPRVLNKQTTKQPFSSTATKANTGSTYKTTSSPKQVSTTKSAYQNTITQTTTTKKSQQNTSSKSVRSPLNSFVANRKNEAYIAPAAPQTKTKPAQLFQEYEDEKETFKEELEDNFVSRQVDLHSSPKKETRVKYAKNQEFRKKSLNLVEEKNDNSIENDQTEATKPIPVTSFKCQDHGSPGYFADLETGCEVFHICQENNRKDSFFCPPGTVFNEMLSVCDWRHNVNCDASNRRSNPSPSFNSNNAFESLNSLRNNHEVEDEEQKK